MKIHNNLRISLVIILIMVVFTCVLPTCAKSDKKSDDTQRIEYLNLSWWDKYNDEILSSYLQDMYKNNQDLKIAKLKTKQAQETIKMMFANQLPHIGFTPEYSETFNSANLNFGRTIITTYSQPNYVLPFTMTYELDIWGKNYLATKSAKRQKDIIAQNERATYITLTSDFASNYYNLIKTDELIDIQKHLVAIQKRIVLLTEKQHMDGMCTVPQVLSEKQYLFILENELDNLNDIREVLSNQLKVYLGDRTISEIKHSPYNAVKTFDIPVLLSSEIVQYRPDVIESEFYIKKTGLDVKVARREILPNINIFGEIGFNAYYLRRVFAHNTFRSLAGVAPSFDLFAGGAKMAKVRYMKFEYQKAVELYDRVILTSLQEINDAMSGAKRSKNLMNRDVERNNLEKTKYELSKEQNSIGTLSDMQKMKAEQSLLLVEKDEVISKINYIISTISLYKSVGGKDYTTEANL